MVHLDESAPLVFQMRQEPSGLSCGIIIVHCLTKIILWLENRLKLWIPIARSILSMGKMTLRFISESFRDWRFNQTMIPEMKILGYIPKNSQIIDLFGIKNFEFVKLNEFL